jgi:hypothetical protein
MTGYKRMLWTLGMVALWALLGTLATRQWDIFSIDSQNYKEIVTAVIAALGMFLSNYIAPFIKQYGYTGSDS